MGKKIVITENLIATLIGHDGARVKFIDMVEKGYDLNKVSQEIFTFGQPSNKIKDLNDYL